MANECFAKSPTASKTLTIAVVGEPVESRAAVAEFIARTPRFAVERYSHQEFEARLFSVSNECHAPLELAIVLVDRDPSAVVSTPPYVASDGRRIPLLALRLSHGRDDPASSFRSDLLEWPNEAEALRCALSLGLGEGENRLLSSFERASILRTVRLHTKLQEGHGAKVPPFEVSGRDLLIPSRMQPAKRIEILRAAHEIDPALGLCPVSSLEATVEDTRERVRSARRLLVDAPEVDSRVFPVAPHASGVAVVGSAKAPDEAKRVVGLCREAAGVRPIENLVFVDRHQHETDALLAQGLARALEKEGVRSADVAVSGRSVSVLGELGEEVNIALRDIVGRFVPGASVYFDLCAPSSRASSGMALG